MIFGTRAAKVQRVTLQFFREIDYLRIKTEMVQYIFLNKNIFLILSYTLFMSQICDRSRHSNPSLASLRFSK